MKAFILLIALGWASLASAYFERGIYSKAGVRAIGMGGAVTAAADDSSDAYWNPAGLALVDSLDVSYEWADIANGSISHSYPAIAIPIPFGWGPVIGASQEIRKSSNSGISVREESDCISGAIPLTRGGLFYAGGNLRYLKFSSSMKGIGGHGFGGDAGFLLRLQRIPLARELRFGAVFQDFDGKITDKTGVTQNLAKTIRLAMAGYPHERLACTAEFEQTWNPSGASWVIARNLRAGAAFLVWGNWLALRAGVVRRMEEIEKTDRTRYFLGTGVNYRGFAFDYAWASKTFLYDADTYMGVSFRLSGLMPEMRKEAIKPEPTVSDEIKVIETAPLISPAPAVSPKVKPRKK
jgi:hypothetical protein